MKSSQFSIAGLMAIVCSAATTIAGIRALYALNLPAPKFQALLFGVPLFAFVQQIALYRVVRCRGRARDFWAGFVAFGFLSAGTFTAAFVYFPESMETPLFVWGAYYELMGAALYWMLPSWPMTEYLLAWWLAIAALLFLSHALVASVGGLLTQRLSTRLHPDLGRVTPRAADSSSFRAPTVSGS